MLQLRICPECQQETDSPKAYFCFRCGAELPPPANTKKALFGKLNDAVPVVNPPKSKHLGRLLLLLGIIIIFALTGYFFSLSSSGFSLPFVDQFTASRLGIDNTPELKTTPLADVNIPFDPQPFSAKGLSELVPGDVDFYIEGKQPTETLKALMPPEVWLVVEGALTKNLSLTSTETASYLEDEFAIVQEGTASAFIAKTRDMDFAESKIKNLKVVSGMQAQIIGSYIVVSNSSELNQSISDSYNKLALNLSLVSPFVKARGQLPASGLLFIYGQVKPWFIPADIMLQSDAYVITKKGNAVVLIESP